MAWLDGGIISQGPAVLNELRAQFGTLLQNTFNEQFPDTLLLARLGIVQELQRLIAFIDNEALPWVSSLAEAAESEERDGQCASISGLICRNIFINRLPDYLNQIELSGMVIYLKETVSLLEPEAEILKYICDIFPESCSQNDFIKICKRSKNTVTRHVKNLFKYNFARKPDGSKYGVVATNTGLEYYRKHF